MEAKIRKIVKHAEIQSLLDIKAFFGEFSYSVIEQLFNESEKTFTLIDKTPYAMFFFVKTDKGYNLFSLLTPKANSHETDIFEALNSYGVDKEVQACVYKGNKKLYNLLKKNNFVPYEEITTGVEKRLFTLLKRG